MELDDRKVKILQAIIRNYLETGEPVGSRTISKYTDLKLSSATIRNEMADLEELGYIIQPHTSAGRIPSDKGYRLYVDTMMEAKVQQVQQMNELLIQKADKLEIILKQVAKLLATNTNYATMVTGPQYKNTKIKFIQLSQVDNEQLLAVIVVDGNLLKNKIIKTKEPLDSETLLKLNILLNSSLQGLCIQEINLDIIQKMKLQAGVYSNIVSDVLDAVAEAIQEEDDLEVYTSGATNILKYPELSDKERATELIYTLEEKQQLANILSDSQELDEHNKIQVYIGSESPVKNMQDCSVVTATYELEKGVHSTIGIIGPKRMDYEKVVNTLQGLMVQLDEIFKKT